MKTFCPWLIDDKSVQYGNFQIKAFENPHGESTSYGFYIQHNELGKLLFVTDAEYVKYDFSALNINHIMVEANYQNEYLDTEKANFEHKVRGHMSLDTACNFIEHNNSPELRTVCLLHANWNTIDEKQAIESIRRIVDIDVKIAFAESGLTIDLKKDVI